MIALAPPPPDYTEFKNRTSVQVRVNQYGSWSSSGQPSHPFVPVRSPSGEDSSQEKRLANLQRAVQKLNEVLVNANAQGVSLRLQTLITALNLLTNFNSQIALLTPHSPHITWSSDAEIVTEWRQGEKRLLFYIEENQISYLKSWGSDIYDEMEEGIVVSSPEVAKLWGWLKS